MSSGRKSAGNNFEIKVIDWMINYLGKLKKFLKGL
jgi:hypothetical protein